MKTKPRTINGASSLFLDAIRLTAALIVLLVHAYYQWFPSSFESTNVFANVAHASVVVFFVLSGYVIAHTTTSNNRGGTQYAQARLSRLYSVLIPALLFTACCEIIIGRIDPALLSNYVRGSSGVRYLLSGLFLNEVWFFSAAPPINEPLWSLGFEFWYYLIFGLWYFRRSGWKGIAIVVAGCLIAGPKILVMMPIWLLGCVAYWIPSPKVRIHTSWTIVFIAICLALLTVVFLAPLPDRFGIPPFFFANQFISDFVVGLFIALAFWNLPTSQPQGTKTRLVTTFRKLGDLTFPIYILNQPLLLLCRCFFNYQVNSYVQLFQAILIVLLVSCGMGILLERYRYRWVQFFKWFLSLRKQFSLRPAR